MANQYLFLHQVQVECDATGVWPGLTIEVDTLNLNAEALIDGIAGATPKTLADVHEVLTNTHALLNAPAQAGEADAAATAVIAGVAGETPSTLADLDEALGTLNTTLDSPAQAGEADAAATAIVAGVAGQTPSTLADLDEALGTLNTTLATPAQAGEADAAATAVIAGVAGETPATLADLLAVLAPPTDLTGGTKTVTDDETPEALVASSTPCRRVWIGAPFDAVGAATNTATVLVGGAASQTRALIATDFTGFVIEIDDAAKVWLKVGADGEGVNYQIY